MDSSRTVYHVTFAANLPTILTQGLLPFQPSNWVKTGDRSRYGDGEIFAFSERRDAIRWAAKMDWEFTRATGSGGICILEIDSDQKWEIDTNDMLSQGGAFGVWLKTVSRVSPISIVKIERLTARLLKEFNWL